MQIDVNKHLYVWVLQLWTEIPDACCWQWTSSLALKMFRCGLEVESTCCSRWGMSSSPSHLLWSLCLELRNAGVIVVLGDAGCRVNTYPHVWELLNHGLNLWFTTWGEHWVSCGSTGEGNSPVWPGEVEPGCTSPRPHLRAHCHWGRISSWRLLLMEFLWAYNTGEHL